MNDAALIGAAQLEQQRIQYTGVGLHVLLRLCRHILQFFTLTGGLQHGQTLAGLIFRDFCGYLHALLKELHQLIIHVVNFLAKFL